MTEDAEETFVTFRVLGVFWTETHGLLVQPLTLCLVYAIMGNIGGEERTPLLTAQSLRCTETLNSDGSCWEVGMKTKQARVVRIVFTVITIILLLSMILSILITIR